MLLWQTVLNRTLVIPNISSYTSDAPNSIRHLVLVEADESLETRLTWTMITRGMDNDTGIPRVKWTHSSTERLYLKALQCQHSQAEAALAPSLLTTDAMEEISSLSTPFSPSSVSVSPISPALGLDPYESNTTPTSPATARTSSTGLSFSFSKLLPRLSVSLLPGSASVQSPTVHTQPPTAPWQETQSHKRRSMPQSPGHFQQSSSAVFSLPVSSLVDVSSPHKNQSTDLFELNDVPTHPHPPTLPSFLTPLVPTKSHPAPPPHPTPRTHPSQIQTSPLIPENRSFFAIAAITETPPAEEKDAFGDFTSSTSPNTTEWLSWESSLSTNTSPAPPLHEE
ncbi:hypothetical protein BDF14DRAFT_237575 [Spinellus fusiger]|nr:hypothetical protein BDF14DRAFT_237575 [Spinellus fusiger]